MAATSSATECGYRLVPAEFFLNCHYRFRDECVRYIVQWDTAKPNGFYIRWIQSSWVGVGVKHAFRQKGQHIWILNSDNERNGFTE